MALQGNLGQIGLADVLQTAMAATRGGELVVTRGPERAVLRLSSEGLFLLEPEVLDAEDVLAAFAERGLLPPEALKALRPGTEKASTVLEGLIASGTIPESQVLELVAGVVEDTVLSLLTWHEGLFRLQENPGDPPRGNIVGKVGVILESVLLRAAQRLDERRVLEQVLGTHALLFRALEAPVPGGEPEEHLEEIHAGLDGRATTDEIALRLGLSRFSVLRAVSTLVEAGAARDATSEELGGALTERLAAKRLRVARDLAMQWVTAHAEDPEGARALVRVGEARERPQEIAAALTLLGGRLLARGEHDEALRAYQDALTHRPGDAPALEGLRSAADVANDPGLWTSATLRLAQGLLEAEDPQQAGVLAKTVLERTPADVSARLLYARACTQLKDREGLVATAQALLDQLGGKATKRVEREAADFCRDALAMLVPERSDLLRNLRALSESRPGSRRKRAVLVSALVVLAATAGVLSWPTSAGRLLESAQGAISSGDKAEALKIIDRLIEEFPESEEAAQAYALQGQLHPTPANPAAGDTPQVPKPAPKLAVAPLVEALRALPSEVARTELQGVVAGLAGRKGVVTPEVLPPIAEALTRLATEARGRRDALALTRAGRERLKDDLPGLRDLLARAEAARDPAALEALRACLPGLQALVEGSANEPLRRQLRELQTEIATLERAFSTGNEDLLEVRRLLAGLELEKDHTACRELGARLLVAGRLQEADALYSALEARLAAVAADTNLVALHESAGRRHMGEFVRDRRALVADIQKGLDAARAATDSGDFATASAAYHSLAQRHYTIRFDDLVRVPMQLDSVPAGAEVLLNGKPMGITPLRLDYPWGGPTTLTVQAPGFDPHVTLLDTNKGQPPVALSARLQPSTRWSAPLAGNVEARPLDVAGDVLVSDRAGRLTLFASADGRVLWTRHLQSLEGARARPTLVPGAIVAAFLDGRVVFVEPRDGTLLAEHQLARPTGDLAALGSVGAMAVGEPLASISRASAWASRAIPPPEQKPSKDPRFP
jgi:tetratricopeptide (TPR) repeat protein